MYGASQSFNVKDRNFRFMFHDLWGVFLSLRVGLCRGKFNAILYFNKTQQMPTAIGFWIVS